MVVAVVSVVADVVGSEGSGGGSEGVETAVNKTGRRMAVGWSDMCLGVSVCVCVSVCVVGQKSYWFMCEVSVV